VGGYKSNFSLAKGARRGQVVCVFVLLRRFLERQKRIVEGFSLSSFVRRSALETRRLSGKCFCWKPGCLIVAFVFVLAVGCVSVGQVNVGVVSGPGFDEASKRAALHNVASEWIMVGTRQYSRGLYDAAEESLHRALEYERYLNAAERKSVGEILEKIRLVKVRRAEVIGHIEAGSKLLEGGEPIKAKAHFEKAMGSEFLTEQEREQVKEKLGEVDRALIEAKKEAERIYKRSVDEYRGGEFEKAREGFVKVAETGLLVTAAGEAPEDYLMRINGVLQKEAALSELREAKRQEPLTMAGMGPIEEELSGGGSGSKGQMERAGDVNDAEIVAIAEPTTGQVSRMNEVERRSNIVRGYTKAVIGDVRAKVEDHLSRGEFGFAKKELARAVQVVRRNRRYLGEGLFREYSEQVKGLEGRIAEARKRWLSGQGRGGGLE